MLKSRSVSQQLIIAFGLILGITAIVGVAGVAGSRWVTTTIQTTATQALPRANHAALLADTSARMEVTLVSYLDHLEIIEQSEEEIGNLTAELVAEVADLANTAVAEGFVGLEDDIAATLSAHRVAAAYTFTFDGTEYTLPAFLEHIAVGNGRYIKAISEATRFGVYEGIVVDPKSTEFARWAAGYQSPDDELAEAIETYVRYETGLVEYVANKIVAKPDSAESQFVRLQARQMPKVERSLATLTELGRRQFDATIAVKTEALTRLRQRLNQFIEAARNEQSAALEEMAASVALAEGRGTLTMFVVMGVFGFGLAVAIAASVFATRRIGKPLGDLSTVIAGLADRNFDIKVPFKSRRDEIGAIALSADTFRENGIAHEALVQEQAEARERAEAERIERVEREHAAKLDVERREREAKEAEDARTAQAERIAEQERSRQQAEQSHVVQTLAEGLQKLASGDLDFQISEKFVDGYEQLRLDFNLAVETLSQTISTISTSAQIISGNVGELTASADDLAQRTERAAASLEETSAAVKQLTTSVKTTSNNAAQTDSSVTYAKDKAEESHAIVDDAVIAMGQIDSSSKNISKIIGVIDDIAFQTNLLALNAGVEAARAGDAGRGFAVVASEVRALAQRSSEAAREINTLISESSSQVSHGVKLVDRVGEALHGIVASVSDISTNISKIAASSLEQADGISEIGLTVSELEGTTQKNAAMFEETTAATRSLSQEAQSLAQSVARFKLSSAPSHETMQVMAAE